MAVEWKKMAKNFSMWMKLLAVICCAVNYGIIYFQEPFLDYEKTKFYYQRDIVVVATVLFFFVCLSLLFVTFVDLVPYKLEIQLLTIGAVMNMVSFTICLIYYVGDKNYIVNSTLLIIIFSFLAALAMGLAMAKACAVVKTQQ